MSQSNSRHGSEIFGEEDNSPFPQSRSSEGTHDTSLPQSESNIHAPRDTDSHQNEHEGSHEASGLLNSLNAPDQANNADDKAAENDDQESLFLFTSERENFSAVNINHESRVVKLLSSESPVEVQISEAGKSNEGMANSLKKYIVYTIKLFKADGAKEEIQTRRRYSDFESLREILNRIFPLVVIPPIPPKNYMALNVWNGLVGNGGTTSPGAQETSHLENSTISGGHNAYSYINSKHLNKGRLIEHRKRLLANFLNNCLRIKQIRNLGFFAKFLDPTANWSDEVALVQSQLPKLIYQLNPENGLKTDPTYAELPIPVSNRPLGLSFLKANKLAQKTTQLLGSATSEIVNATSPSRVEDSDHDDSAADISAAVAQVLRPSHLDDINKKIMSNLIGLSNDYVDLGVALNSISLGVVESPKTKKDTGLDDTTKLDFIFDKIGSAFDRSYLTLNSLMAELETKFSEPLGEAVQYTTVLNSVNKFHDRKLKQQSLIDNELSEKRKELADKMRLEIEASKKDPNGVQNGKNASKEPRYKSGGFMSKMSSLKKITDYVSTMIDQTPELTRKDRISQLQKRIVVLEQCQKIMLEDIAFVMCEIDKNQESFKEKEYATILLILRSYNTAFISWARKNLEIWEEIKEEIEKTEF